MNNLNYGVNVEGLLHELSQYESGDIGEFEAYGEDDNGCEGSASIDITFLAADALNLIKHLRNRLAENEATQSSNDVHEIIVPGCDSMGWKVDPDFISRVQDAIGSDEECACWEGTPSMEMVEAVLMAAARLTSQQTEKNGKSALI
ncbi:hypothetical protein ABEG75_22795 [Pantoea agglomerans]|uniref:hypothetical protein n=1 Tax=Enterobacter agglomerans TaxID=549 RepID=UPI00165439FF|nr:hypothetical protein [Pantoea agglomerans]